MNDIPTRRPLIFAAALAGVLVSSSYGRIAAAADHRLGQAAANVARAIALLEAAKSPDPKKELGGHRKKAIVFLKNAAYQIQKAKEVGGPGPKTAPAHKPAAHPAKPAARKPGAAAGKAASAPKPAKKQSAKHD
jgi:hypothetical protein